MRLFIWFLGFFTNLEGSQWDNEVIDGLTFLEHSVLQVPFFLMSLMRYITPTLDRMFMDSLDWVDRTYIAKHQSEDPNTLRAMYYENLKLYPTHGVPGDSKASRSEGIQAFLWRYARKVGFGLGIYTLSHIPHVGRFVLPAVSFWTFNNAVGWEPAVVIFGTSIFLPRRYLVSFLQSYFSSRSLMRELVSSP